MMFLLLIISFFFFAYVSVSIERLVTTENEAKVIAADGKKPILCTDEQNPLYLFWFEKQFVIEEGDWQIVGDRVIGDSKVLWKSRRKVFPTRNCKVVKE